MLVNYVIMFSVEHVEHKCELRLATYGASSTGEVNIILQGMSVDMNNYPPRRAPNGAAATVQNGQWTAFFEMSVLFALFNGTYT